MTMVSFGVIILLFLSGRIYESVRRLVSLIFNILLKILNLFGIKISSKEYRIRTSHKFKETFEDIKIVKKSKENNRLKPSINIIALTLLIISISIVIINLDSISNNYISAWLFKNNPIPNLIKTQESMDSTLTAALFSTIAFSISKLIYQWKETSKFRKAKKEMRKKKEILQKLSSKELLDAAKQKDLDMYNSSLKKDGMEGKVESNAKNF